MPSSISSRLVAACALVLALSLPFAAGAAAKGFTAQLRVVGAGNKVLAEKTVRTADTTIKTSPKALCFGSDAGGSGKPATIEGGTALGLLASAAVTTGPLRPLLITDHFSFGLALCGIGKSVVPGGSESSWFFKVNHKVPSVGGDQAKIKSGDEVLWDLAPSYPYPDELALSAPAKATAGTAFKVHVFSYDEKGKRTPAKGVKVTGAAEPTAADGTTTVTLAKPTKLIATDEADIPSPRVAVCLGGKCPAGS